jgi:hypothetical protein
LQYLCLAVGLLSLLIYGIRKFERGEYSWQSQHDQAYQALQSEIEFGQRDSERRKSHSTPGHACPICRGPRSRIIQAEWARAERRLAKAKQDARWHDFMAGKKRKPLLVYIEF